ncbi:MAG TPA: Crp/Fnr family transcriptional regulator [Clostridiales bacterium UBA8960]|nr:Crp/Fnr family transcriptional regulator [Clostridiales bacterium UBA8960]
MSVHPYKSYSLLKDISKDMIETYKNTGHMSQTNVSKNEVLHFDGEVCKNLEIVLSGKISVDRIDESGNILTISEFLPDDMLGGNLIFSSTPIYPMTVTANLDSTIFKISKEAVFELCASNNAFLKAYLKDISDHTLLLGDKIKHTINRTIRESITALLMRESLMQQSTILALPTTKKALAERIGVQRTSLSRELQKMKREGLIDYDAKTITLKNLCKPIGHDL